MISQVKQILKLNNNFYQSVSKEFSKSRQKPWVGWDRLVDIIGNHHKGKYKILDLGCGNGRFYDFVKGKILNCDYLGCDINNDLIIGAKEKHSNRKGSNAKFEITDIFEDIKCIKGKYNLVVGFGITHHIPNSDYRKQWFLDISKLLATKSILTLTFWKFNKNSGDYLIGWSNKDVARYCHQYSKKELYDLIQLYKKHQIKLIDKYESDNKNTYLVFGKI